MCKLKLLESSEAGGFTSLVHEILLRPCLMPNTTPAASRWEGKGRDTAVKTEEQEAIIGRLAHWEEITLTSRKYRSHCIKKKKLKCRSEDDLAMNKCLCDLLGTKLFHYTRLCTHDQRVLALGCCTWNHTSYVTQRFIILFDLNLKSVYALEELHRSAHRCELAEGKASLILTWKPTACFVTIKAAEPIMAEEGQVCRATFQKKPSRMSSCLMRANIQQWLTDGQKPSDGCPRT